MSPSAKVIVREFDFSNYLKALVDLGVGVVGLAEKGPLDTRELITTREQLIDKFGEPAENRPAVWAAYIYLGVGNVLYFTRVAGTDKAKASAVVQDSSSIGSLRFEAVEYGSWYNRLNVEIDGVSGEDFNVTIVDSRMRKKLEVYRACRLDTVEARINGVSKYVVVDVLTGGTPVAVTKAMTGGNDGDNATVAASLTTGLVGENNGLVWTAVDAGTVGNEISIEYVDPGGAGALSHTVVGKAISFTLAHDGMNVTTTASELKAYVVGKTDIENLVSVVDAVGSDGTGLLTAMTATNLTGGKEAPNYVGVVSGLTRTGLQLYASRQEVDVYALAVPGVTDEATQSELLKIAGMRKDCVSFLDVPKGLSVQSAVDFHNGEGAYAARSALQGFYGTIEYGWQKVYNPYNQNYEYVPPCCARLYALGVAVRDYEIWYPQFGFRRGLVSWSLGPEYSPTEGERDMMVEGTNALNPISDMPGLGTLIMDQKTLARSGSALDELNVRFILIMIRRAADSLFTTLIGEPNDEILWREFVNIFEPWLARLVDRRGIYDFRVRCDSTTTTAVDIDNNVMRARVAIKPTKPAKIIVVDINVLRTGANFDEYVGTETEFSELGI